MNKLQLAWGLKHELDGDQWTAAWGARAIWNENRNFIDLLWDRQGWSGDASKFEQLADWLNDVGLKELKRRMDDARLTQSGMDVVMQSSEPFHIWASPNASYGYLYITAAMKRES